MAMQETAAPTPEVVGNAFVEQYYHILHQSPGLAHRFYQDSSSLSRPDASGHMTTVTTMQAINDKILSLNYEDYTAEIKTADSQESYGKGVIVLVTGCLTGKDNIKMKFTQTFFLAPQDKGYFVLNDVFRFVGDSESFPINTALTNGINENAPPAAVTPQSEPTQATDHLKVEPATSLDEEDLNNDAEFGNPSEKDEGSVIEVEVVEPASASTQNEIFSNVDQAPPALEDAPKKSYASILKLMQGNIVARPAHVLTANARGPPAKSEQSLNSAKPASVPESPTIPTGGDVPESSDIQKEAEGYSIYVRNLPYDARVEQLEEVFKKFGNIKLDGIQVRSNKQGFCFGFVEFETLSSMRSALEASPITVGDREAIVEEKKTTTRVGSSGKGRYLPGRSEFRNNSFKSRGNFGRERAYGRNEVRNQGEFSGRPRGSSGYNADNYQLSNQNGSRRGGRQGGFKGGSVST